MEHYVGIDVSLNFERLHCRRGRQNRCRAKVESHPDAIVAFVRKAGVSIERIGWRPGAVSVASRRLTKGGFETVLLETRHVKAALSAKTDRRDRAASRSFSGWAGSARFIANRQAGRSASIARGAQATGHRVQHQRHLRGFGLRWRCDAHGFRGARAGLCAGQAMLEQIAEAMLAARTALLKEYSKLHKQCWRSSARRDCRD